MNKHVAFLFCVVLLAGFGSTIIGIDVWHNHVLHVTNAVVGSVALLLAIAFALPLRLRVAIDILTPFLIKMRTTVAGSGTINVG